MNYITCTCIDEVYIDSTMECCQGVNILSEEYKGSMRFLDLISISMELMHCDTLGIYFLSPTNEQLNCCQIAFYII